MSYESYILNEADKHMESDYCRCGLEECQCNDEDDQRSVMNDDDYVHDPDMECKG